MASGEEEGSGFEKRERGLCWLAAAVGGEEEESLGMETLIPAPPSLLRVEDCISHSSSSSPHYTHTFPLPYTFQERRVRERESRLSLVLLTLWLRLRRRGPSKKGGNGGRSKVPLETRKRKARFKRPNLFKKASGKGEELKH